VRERLDRYGAAYELSIQVSGEPFLSPPGILSDAIAAAVQQVTGITPELSTTGGTSDARFIKDYCPVAEFGLISDTAHKADEHVLVADIHALTDIYKSAIDEFFQSAGK